jgi:hypothetical protein
MRLAVKAWRLRESARRALEAGDFDKAARLAAEAQSTQATPAGQALWVLSEWLSCDPRAAGGGSG